MHRPSLTVAVGLLLFCALVIGVGNSLHQAATKQIDVPQQESRVDRYWFILNRKSNKELLYKGVPGDTTRSRIVKTFVVKGGIKDQRPTPLPQLVGRRYWNIIAKEPTDNPETGPYFLTLDIPTSDEWPYGPTPYLECDGQCDWVTMGYFGLHGVGGDPARLSDTDPGSSGCIRHTDTDIAYLYNLLHPHVEPIRYYVQDI